MEAGGRVPWSLKDVAVVYVMRIVLGLLLVRIIYPMFFQASPLVVEMTDRLLMIVLVWHVLARHHSTFSDWGLSFRRLARNVAWGLVGGAILLGASTYSGRIYSEALMLAPAQHPLAGMAQNAANFRQLAIPLFLAGVAAPVAEEILYRMFTFLPMKERIGLWGGAMASAVIFTVVHFNVYWIAEMMVAGIGLALLYYWSGSLLSAIVAHSFINTSKILMLYFNIPII